MVRQGVVFFTAAIMAAGITPNTYAQGNEDTIFSPLTASVFVKTAREIFREDPSRVELAMRFLEAADALDRGSADIPEQVLRIGAESCMGRADYSQTMTSALRSYIGRQFDLEVALSAIRCMLSHLDTRQDREALLGRMLRRYAPVNERLGSELATQLGLLAMEKTDIETARHQFNYAYSLNPYNDLAFQMLREVYAAEGLAVSPEAFAVHLRKMMDVNPYGLSAALRYADFLRQFELYAPAARMYEYADSVFQSRFPDQRIDQSIYLPWLLSCYHTPRLLTQCLDLAERFRSEATFDLMLEAVAGRAAAKLGRAEQARRILEQAAEKAEQMLGEKDLALPIYPEHLAWFFSFILERPDNALAWSNQAFSQAPDRQGVRAVFAYTLAVNEQYELARQYAESSAQSDQTAAITMALVHRHEGNRQEAIDLLRRAIAMDADTFEAEKAKSLLTDLGADYLAPPIAQAIEKTLEEQFSSRVVPVYTEPRQRFATKLMFSSSNILYGAEFDARLVIENNSSAPLLIQDEGMLTGVIRVDAVVRGDLTMQIPDVLTMRFRPNRPIQPNEHIFIPLDLRTGKLRRLLATYPQATLELEFSVYLDPVLHEDGTVSNALRDVSPVRATLRRRGVNLTRDFMMQRLDALAKGQEGQKILAARLFAGLLAEQEAFRRGQADYGYTRVEPSLLVDSVRRVLTDENWPLRVHIMEEISHLEFSSDFALIQTLSANLDHNRWPVRFMTLYLLSRIQGDAFQPVLDWKAQYDPHPLTRRLAVALGGKEPPQPQRDPR
ncbi:MAG TPA: hypothetical protein ENN97_03280 [Phycisphaerales bacterium]|nr:hypothetical protein [Phycisphaerales bacterium]